MATSDLASAVRELAIKLANGEYEKVIAECSASRLSSSDLRKVINDYGRTLIAPPTDAYQDLDAVAVRDSAAPTWSVWAPLWSEEEGRSDLKLHLTIQRQGDRWVIEIDDLHVP